MSGPTRKRVIVGCVLVLVCVAVSAVITFIGSFTLFECEDTVVKEWPSADGQLVMVVFERDCGATTRTSVHGCIRRASSKLKAKKQPSAFAFEKGTNQVTATWENNRKVVVTLPYGVHVFHREPAVDGIEIGYPGQ